MSTVLAFLQACRPRQWFKNLAVAAPLVFSKRLDDPATALRGFYAFVIFCAISSAAYLWNDVVDVEKDRAHPKKKLRPIAAGRLSPQAAQVLAATLAAGALGSSLLIDPWFAGTVGAYLVLMFAYSPWLKRMAYIDVFSIALGFLFRVMGGSFAVSVESSEFLLLCTGLGALYLGFGKRAHELANAKEKAGEQRTVLRFYRPDALRRIMIVTGLATFMAYCLYTIASHTVNFFGTHNMVWTLPFAAFGLFRFWKLVTRHEQAESPTDAMLRDPLFMVNLALFILAVVVIIYRRFG